jgi:sporulation related protein
MADRYQGRPFRADDDDDHRADPHAPAGGESDPLAELARLIGQTDAFGSMGRANARVQPRSSATQQYQPAPEPEPEPDEAPPAGPPPWMQRATRQEAAPQDYPNSVHPLQRYATPRAAPVPDYPPAPDYADPEPELDPSRYDDALYGQLDADAEQSQHDPAYADDDYAYQDGYGEGAEEQVEKRRGGMVTVIVVLALAVVGTGAAFAYRTYVGSPRTGEPPIIRADSGPTKIMPAPSDGNGKVPDRMAPGDGTEKIVPREEAPVDVNARSGPRVVFPPLNQNGNPPPAASVAPSAFPPPSAGNGTLPNNEPRKIKTLTVRGDQPDDSAQPVAAAPPPAPPAKPAPAAKSAATPRNPPASANASANTPLSLAPQGNQPEPAAEPRARVATNTPLQTAPAPAASSSSSSGGGGYLVQVSSQRNEADAQASYRALQGKFPAVLGSHNPVIKRADLGEKGVYYRAMVGPFGSPDEASQFCGSLKSAGGQCVVQRN